MGEKIISVTGLSPLDNGIENAKILQNAVDRGGVIEVNTPGVYRLAETIVIGDHTHIHFGRGVYFERMPSPTGTNGNAFINKGAFSGEKNTDISIDGLWLNVNDVEHSTRYSETDRTITGLRGHLAFLYVENLTLTNIVVLGLNALDYGIQISDFSDVKVEDIRIEGNKDGIHFGPGSGFVLRRGVFRTYDDPIALNGSDYSVSNPNLGWIENGLIEDCYDLEDKGTVGFFARLLCGGWRDWFKGMEVQHSDAVVYNGRLYRVVMQPSFETYISEEPPTHESGYKTVDGIRWNVIHPSQTYTAGVRNVIFRNIYLQKTRTAAIGMLLDKSEYLRSYYPGSKVPVQENITLENIYISGKVEQFLQINSPLDGLVLKNCDIGRSKIVFDTIETEGLTYPKCELCISNCSFEGEPIEVKNDYPLSVTKEI